MSQHPTIGLPTVSLSEGNDGLEASTGEWTRDSLRVFRMVGIEEKRIYVRRKIA